MKNYEMPPNPSVFKRKGLKKTETLAINDYTSNGAKKSTSTQKNKKPYQPAIYPLFDFQSNKSECYYCSSTLSDANRSKDHIYPKHLGGAIVTGNWVYCCTDCNGLKGGKTLLEFRLYLAGIIPHNNFTGSYIQRISRKVDFMISKLYPDTSNILSFSKGELINKIFELEKLIGKYKYASTKKSVEVKALEKQLAQEKEIQKDLLEQIVALKNNQINISLTTDEKIAIKKDEQIINFKAQHKSNTETIKRIRKDNQELILQVILLNKTIEELKSQK